MWIAQTIEQCCQRRAELTAATALVPTMGALHDGHIAHIQAARRAAADVIVSIFVNPAQFGPSEDFDHYPRPIASDLTTCEREGVTGVFQPGVEDIYPPHIPPTSISVPTLTRILEGARRPGHFEGVCRVVLKLLHIVQPDLVTFGRKDYQQLCVVRAMIEDLALPIVIVPIDTVRDDDGLASSSRNAYLDTTTRRQALGLHAALLAAAETVERSPSMTATEVEAVMHRVMDDHGLATDYAVVREAESCAELPSSLPVAQTSAIALVAGHAAGVRLIDNQALGREA